MYRYKRTVDFNSLLKKMVSVFHFLGLCFISIQQLKFIVKFFFITKIRMKFTKIGPWVKQILDRPLGNVKSKIRGKGLAQDMIKAFEQLIQVFIFKNQIFRKSVFTESLTICFFFSKWNVLETHSRVDFVQNIEI